MLSFEEALKALGIEQDAGPKGAKEAYESLMGPGLSPKLERRLNEAFDMLKNPRVWAGGGSATVGVGAAVEAEARLFATVRSTPEVAAALERLGSEHPEVIDIGDLAAALDAGAVDGASGLIRALLQKGHVAAGADTLRVLFGLIATFKTVEWLKARTAVRLLLVAYGCDTECQHSQLIGRALSALQQWKAAVGDARFGYEGVAARGLTWATELNKMSPDVHKTIRLAVAQAASRGDLSRARIDVERFARKDPSAAAASKQLLDRRADVSRAIYDLLPSPEAAEESKPSLPDFELATWAKRGLIVCIILVAGQLVFGGDKKLDATQVQLHHAKEQVCQALGERTAGCVFAGAIQQNLSQGQCGGVDRLRGELDHQLKDYKDRRGGVVVGDKQEGAADAQNVFAAIHLMVCARSAGDAAAEE